MCGWPRLCSRHGRLCCAVVLRVTPESADGDHPVARSGLFHLEMSLAWTRLNLDPTFAQKPYLSGFAAVQDVVVLHGVDAHESWYSGVG